MTQNKPIRVLHSFGSLGKGGIETWLMNILRLQPTELQFDFFLGVLGGAYEAEARSYGCRIHHAPPIRQLGKNLHFLEEVLASHEYDVLHIHGEEFMGDGMKVAARVGVPVRIAHSHNTQLARGKKGFEIRIRSWRHRTLDRIRIIRYATDVLACSNDAGHFLVGCRWDDDPRCKALFCGVPLDQFCDALSRIGVELIFERLTAYRNRQLLLDMREAWDRPARRTIRSSSRSLLNWPDGTGVIIFIWRVMVRIAPHWSRRSGRWDSSHAS